ncbi:MULTISPECIES: MutS-related protein [Enterococcus]|uniref:DNA mismatch repair proteins mutS family domain-containing protein n=1 Tax=Candidatus Enterococcus ferrettii TaxID=2815324 RepID=A0ABV0EWT6_9ENTE|nr:DNA mismatch repair protein MutS [Enterococcus sp. 665A]MBO1341495.1 DNA mismatch repair protein MutS [Enterococcus sp. 665A]
MKEITIIIGFALLIFFALFCIDLWSKHKLKQRIHYAWGKIPEFARNDREESLITAWEITKQLQDWDSEIDDATWHDLDMQEIFQQINLTYSSIGSESLYQRLRSFQFAQDELEELIAFFENQPELREKIQYQFARLGKLDNNLIKNYLLKEQTYSSNASFWFYLVIGLLPLLGLLWTAIAPSIGLLLLVGSLCFNTILSMIKKNSLERELTSMRYLVNSVYTAKKLQKFPLPNQSQLVAPLTALKSITRVGFAFKGQGVNEADVIVESLMMCLMIPFISYHFVQRKLRNHKKEALHLWEAMGDLESALAVLNFRMAIGSTCLPKFKAGGLTAEECYHPLVGDPVPNPVTWQKNTLISGSNASGKSTYVKSIAINCILAQTIHTALAESFIMEPGHVLTSMAVEDNVIEGDSYFIAEIKSIKRLLNKVASQERCYCFIDEILRGTNTVERIAASASIVHWLQDYNSLAFIATHDIELTEMLKNECRNLHFSERITSEEGIAFDYLVKEGPTTTRNALRLLEIMDYPTSITIQARKELAAFEKNRSWNVFAMPND